MKKTFARILGAMIASACVTVTAASCMFGYGSNNAETQEITFTVYKGENPVQLNGNVYVYTSEENCTFVSSNTNVVQVFAIGETGSQFRARGIKAGTAVITATSESGKTGTYEITVVDPDDTTGGGSTGGGSTGGTTTPVVSDNLITSANIGEFYFAPGWNVESTASASGNLSSGFTFNMTKATSEQWQAQLKLTTDADIVSGKTYQFTCTLRSNVALSGVTVKIQKNGSDDDSNNTFLFAKDKAYALDANADKEISVKATSSVSITDALVIFDFGANPASTVKISNLKLVETEAAGAWSDATASAGAESPKAIGSSLNIAGLENYKLVGADEFTSADSDGTPLNSKWGYDIGRGLSKNTDGTNPGNWAWGNNEVQWYSDNDPDNTWVSNGTLKIRAIKETGPDGDATHTSGRIVTRNISGAQWKYGYIEMRAKIPTEAGVWPAFWMLDNDIYAGQGWPLSGEIDIMESSTSVWGVDQVYGTLHCKSGSGGNPIYTAGTTLDDIAGAWHTYAVKWDENGITWYYDGVPAKWTLGNQRGDADATYTPNNVNSESDWPYNEPFYIIINLAVGGNLGGQIGNWNESTMTIDYVRVYQ